MNFNKLNNLTGWTVCIIACTVYLLTMEATGSLWDCGEFTAAAWKLQIPHPPGAPLFLLIGRLFTLWFPPAQVGIGMNILSALASGFTILFLCWTITHFARKLLVKAGETPNREQTIAILGAGITGALAYTFSDSFWFSAVEGEVYALSSLFTAMVFWAILRWEQEAEQPYADRWLVFIAFIIGLSIGVHLLNLLTIPAITMVYYFKRYHPTTRGALMAFLISCGITGIIQIGLIQYPAKLAGSLDILLVNGLGLPFNSGVALFAVIVGVLLYTGVRWATRRRYYLARLAFVSTGFLFLGYSTYITTLIRANANPAINMQNVNNPVALKGYLGREQYGDFPLFYGQVYTAKPQEYKSTGNEYTREKDHYVISRQRYKAVFNPQDEMLFPRIWDNDSQQGHPEGYRQWLGLMPGERPSFADNLRYFFSYQLNFMYFRYFMWNFAGKQNDVQGNGNVRDSNWISGISFIDNLFYGDQSRLPDSLKNNKGRNTLFFLPLLLGIAGLLYHYRHGRKDSLIVGLLFFFTGIAIVLYINQPPMQPRERDYAYAGSFYAFAIWIGLGVAGVYAWLKKRSRLSFSAPLATLGCLLAVPVLMGFQEWDDHDRSQKTIAPDMARNYLESCAPNAIVITYGDNDTYPLWYAQEVEGVRPDIRLIHATLLSADWYINQQRRRINNSAPVPMQLTPEQYTGDKRDYILYYDAGIFPQDKFYNLKEVISFMGSDQPDALLSTARGDKINYLPARRLFLPVDKSAVVANGTVSAADSARIISPLAFTINKEALYKNELALLDMLAANNWERPVYVTTPMILNGLGLAGHLQQEGLTYRLVPLEADKDDMPVNTDRMYRTVMQHYTFAGANVPGTYFDDANRGMLQRLRDSCAQLAIALAAKGDQQRALQVLDKMDKNLLESNFPYGMVSNGNFHNITSMKVAYAYYIAGNTQKAGDIARQIRRDCEQQVAYYQSLPASKLSSDLRQDYEQITQYILPQLDKMATTFNGVNRSPLQ